MKTANRPHARARRLGYTLMEVMAALTILAVGATGVVGMQKVTALGNSNARNVAAASSLATAWAERLHADAVRWTDPGNLGATRWLQLTDSGTVTDLEAAGFGAERADLLGADIYLGDDNTTAFCTQITMTTLYPDLIRAEIQVFWDRNGGPVACPVGDPPPAQYGVNSIVTSIRQNIVPTPK